MNPGRSADTMTCLPSSAARLADRRLGLVVGRAAADELDQRHDRHRAEEVHADEPGRARLADGRGERVDRDRRRVRGEDRGRPGRCRRGRAHSVALDVEVLEHRLDHEVGVARRRRGRRSRRGARASRRAPRRGAGPSRPRARGCRRSGRGRPRPAPGPARTGSTVLADRRVDLRDAVAHQPGAGDEDALDASSPERTPRLGSLATRRRRAGPTSRTRAERRDDRAAAGTRRRSRPGRERARRTRRARCRTRRRGTRSSVPDDRRRAPSSATRDDRERRAAPGTVNATPDGEDGGPEDEPDGRRDEAD